MIPAVDHSYVSLFYFRSQRFGKSLEAGNRWNVWLYIDGLVQKRRNSSALAMELRLFRTNPSLSYSSYLFLQKLSHRLSFSISSECRARFYLIDGICIYLGYVPMENRNPISHQTTSQIALALWIYFPWDRYVCRTCDFCLFCYFPYWGFQLLALLYLDMIPFVVRTCIRI